MNTDGEDLLGAKFCLACTHSEGLRERGFYEHREAQALILMDRFCNEMDTCTLT